jgi:hypothetical protein
MKKGKNETWQSSGGIVSGFRKLGWLTLSSTRAVALLPKLLVPQIPAKPLRPILSL